MGARLPRRLPTALAAASAPTKRAHHGAHRHRRPGRPEGYSDQPWPPHPPSPLPIRVPRQLAPALHTQDGWDLGGSRAIRQRASGRHRRPVRLFCCRTCPMLARACPAPIAPTHCPDAITYTSHTSPRVAVARAARRRRHPSTIVYVPTQRGSEEMHAHLTARCPGVKIEVYHGGLTPMQREVGRADGRRRAAAPPLRGASPRRHPPPSARARSPHATPQPARIHMDERRVRCPAPHAVVRNRTWLSCRAARQ